MKTLLVFILAALASGCAANKEQFAQNFAQGMQFQAYQAQQRQQAYQPPAAPKQIDYACVTQCANGGTLYARCVSLCSY